MLNLILLALILLIVFMQAVYGFFSSLIMAICTLVCTLLAFSYYEPVGAFAAQWLSEYSYGVALIVLLAGPLAIVRILVDMYLPGNIVASVWVDRVCGGLTGLFSALLLTGTLLIALQMLPFDAEFLGYNPYDDNLAEQDSLMINSPAFTLFMVESLSSGSMSGDAFTDQHENLVLETWGIRNRDKGASVTSTEKSAKLKELYDVTSVQYPGSDNAKATFGVLAPKYPGLDASETKVLLARISFDADCRDADGWWRISATQLQLKMSNGQFVFPVGYLVYSGDWSVVSAPIGSMRISREPGSSLIADVLFRTPLGGTTDDLKPLEISFRHNCDMPIKQDDIIESELPDTKMALLLKEVYGESKVVPSGSKIAFVARPTRAFINPTSPFMFTVANSNDSEFVSDLAYEQAIVKAKIRDYKFSEGIIYGPGGSLMKMNGGSTSASMGVNAFAEPDKMKAVKLVCEPIKSQGLLGGIASKVQAFQPQIRVAGETDRFASGAWVKWNEDGQNYSAMFYSEKEYKDPNLDEPALNPAINDILNTYLEHRTQASEFGLVFLVPDDSKVTGFRMTGSERYNCESPLSTGKRPRGHRR